jgi:UDP-N-acetylmuramoylalanine--D-glutamate ligase
VRRSDLAGRRVAVWGIGREGQAAARAAMGAGAADVVAVADTDPPPLALAAWAAAGLGGVPVLPVPPGGADAEVVVLSPGVSRYRPEVLALEASGVSVTNGTELYLAEQGRRTIAVTGSKGKSTVTRLIAHLLAAVGRDAVAAGNIGAALPDLLAGLPVDLAAGPLVVAEVSSYQAALVASPPRVAVLTSLFPDHLPWHGGLDRYVGDKLRLLAGAEAVLVNGADPGVRSVLGRLEGPVVFASPDARVRVAGGAVVVGGDIVVPLHRSRLPGAHNAVNVAAAVAVLDALGIDVAGVSGPLEEALAAFAPLPHRLEPVHTAAGVTYVDDSLATSAQAAVAACEAYDQRPLTLLVGGLDRGIDYSPLVGYLEARVARTPLAVVAMGAAGRRIAAGLRSVPIEAAHDLGEAVRIAAKGTPAGGVVLFSPAAASPAEYGTYEQRSAAFVDAARELD